MSKKSNKKQNLRQAAPAAVVKAPPKDYLQRHSDETTDANALWRRIFAGLAAFGLLLLLLLSLRSGINADDRFQVDYSEKLINYYGSWGRDTAALNIPDGNMHLYGGFFETLAGAVNKIAGLDPNQLAYHQTRHLLSAFWGWVAILCAGLLARRIAGWRAGCLAVILLLVSPRFVGDSLMNPKDIPFAAGYMLALYHLAAVLDGLPRPNRWNVAGLIAGLGISLSMRAGGLLAFAILFMFAGLHFLLRHGGLRALANWPLLKRYAAATLGAAVLGYVLALLFWPFALQAPLTNPFVALSKFEDLDVKIRVLYEGANVMSDKTPWHYPLKWILLTTPLSALAGIAISLTLLPHLLRRFNPLWIGLLLFGGFFPVLYVVWKDAVIHDGWRHLSFVWPPLAALAAVGWHALTDRLAAFKAGPYLIGVALGALSLDAAAFIARNSAFPYVYFNPLIGGIKGAFGRYETDYWALSIRQGVEWLEREGILSQDRPEPVVIATNMFYPLRRLTYKYGDDKVQIKYLRWERRCDDTWDYAFYTSRFVSGASLQKDAWPPSNTAHTISADGVPLLAILKNDANDCAEGMQALKNNDIETAIAALQRETARNSDNEVAWTGLATALLNAQRLDEMKQAAEKALSITPDETQASNLIGMYYMYQNRNAEAKAHFEKSLRQEPANAGAWYYLAVIASNQRDFSGALNCLNKATEVNPNFRMAYELAANIYEQQGNPQRAAQIRAAVQNMR